MLRSSERTSLTEQQRISSLRWLSQQVSKLQSLEKENLDYEKRICRGFTTEFAMVKKSLSETPPSGAQKCFFLQNVREQEEMQSIKNFLRWYNNKDVVPTLDAVQKNVKLYHNKSIDMIKLG